MKTPKRRCHFCQRWFQPNPRNPHRQQTCSSPACQRKRRAENNRQWQRKNSGYGKGRKQKICTWAKEYPDYWRKYRREHPDYAEKERRRMRSVRRLVKSVAKQDAIANDAPGERQYEYASRNLGRDQALLHFDGNTYSVSHSLAYKPLTL
ncbi:MAG: hypothetical protein QME05_03080, partial [Candidatus Margulisbacteria bacterium]|nr:hypothetical protein [Candidatus Margulisiibacteriota bacterium]